MKSFLAIVLASLAAATALSHNSPDTGYPALLERQVADLASSSVAQPNLTFDQLWKFNKKFLDNFIYPADVKQAQAINSTIFSDDVQGRVDVTRTFTGRELNTEYIFGLFANLAGAKPGAITLLGVPLSYEIINFAANQNIVSSLTRFVPQLRAPFTLPIN